MICSCFRVYNRRAQQSQVLAVLEQANGDEPKEGSGPLPGTVSYALAYDPWHAASQDGPWCCCSATPEGKKTLKHGYMIDLWCTDVEFDGWM